jgi:salicylate hydroxylase
MDRKKILIAGAGIGGLSAALALLRRGIEADVFEQSARLGDVGAGIMLTPNATRTLAQLGVESELLGVSIEPEASIYRRFDSGELMLSAPLRGVMEPRHGAKYLHIHRADLHAILVAAVRRLSPDCIHLDRTLADYRQDAAGVTAQFADGTRAIGDALIGCDGARSTVRERTFGGTTPSFTGQVAWRGVVPSNGLPASVTAPASTIWIGEDRHIVQYPLRGGRAINYVALVAKAAWQEEGWNRRSAVGEVVAEFADFHPDVQQLLQATPAENCFKWGLHDRDPLAAWTRGRVTLLGDAAHPTLPFMAQGAAMSIEDGAILSRAIERADSLEAGLQQYERLRLGRTSAIVLRSRAATQLYQRLIGDKQEERSQGMAEIYDYDAERQPLCDVTEADRPTL